MKLHRLSDRLAISDAPGEDDLRHLATQGIRSIIDLRADGEPRPRGLALWDEARLAGEMGLAYRQIPVEPPRLGDHLGAAVRQALRQATPAVLLHCTTGRRAGAFGLIAVACDEALSVDECIRRGRVLGLDFDGMPRLTAFLNRYLEKHGERADGPASPHNPLGPVW